MIRTKDKEPLVYSCSGCSSAAQMTNYLAVQLDRKGIAEMSCIAGIGGNVKNIVRTARSEREIIVIDGCPLACSKSCLVNHDVKPDLHFELTSLGVKKKYHEDFDLDEAKKILRILEDSIEKGEEKLNGDLVPVNRIVAKTDANISIVEVKTKQQLREFIDYPYHLYKGNKYFVPQLKNDVAATFDKTKNPAFDFCEAKYWLAYKNGKPVGRIAGIINHSFIETWKQRSVRFGWLDFEEDETIAGVLLNEVEQWAKQKGMEVVHGPLGFTNFDYAGMLTNGFNETGTFATIYNHPYYKDFIEKAGYKKEIGWVEYQLKVPAAVPEKLVRAASIVERRFQLKPLPIKRQKDILPYAKKIFELINSAYSGLFGVVPMTGKQIQYNIRKYFSFIKPQFVSLIVDNNNELAAVGIAMPSLSNALQKANGKLYPFGFLHLMKAFRRNKFVDLCLVAIRKDLQGKGVNAILMRDMTEAFIQHGVKYAESNPELEENKKVQSLWEYYEARQHKHRQCFIKYL